MPKDLISDHGLAASVEEVFAFGNPQGKVETSTKAAQIIEQKVEPVGKPVQITAQKARPVVTAQSDSRKAEPVKNEAQTAEPAAIAVQTIAQKAKAVVRAVQVTAQKAEPFTRTAQIAPTVAPNPLEVTAQVLSESPRPPDLPTTSGRELKTAAELAAMIELDLTQHPESPKKGLRVTVYGGATNWRAMLTIMPAAGAVRSPQQLRDLTDQLAERLRQRYDLAWD